MKWVRAKDGAVCGVCKGLARNLDIPVGLFRFLWVLSVLVLGLGIWVYFLLALCLPREDRQAQALESRVLGVCARIAKKTEVEVGIIRFLTVCLGLLSFGATVVGYVVLYFVIDSAKTQTSDNKPTTPPATT